MVAEAVIDLFEAVQVEIHHRQRGAVIACAAVQHPLQPFA